MSGNADAQEDHRYRPPHTARHQIPTISKYREEKKARKDAAQHSAGQQTQPRSGDFEHDGGHDRNVSGSNGDTAAASEQLNDRQTPSDDGQPAIDTSEADAAATDPRARRKELKNRKDERADREVTDPVTHLPIKIHDLTSQALEEIPENAEPWGATAKTATGTSNVRKSAKQLHDEIHDLQAGHDSMRALFPPPQFDVMKRELSRINKLGITAGLVGSAAVFLIAGGIERFLDGHALSHSLADRLKTPGWIVYSAFWLLSAGLTLAAITALAFGVRDWVGRRIESLWEDQVWDEQRSISKADNHSTETVAWLNALLGSVWPLINPDLFISLADTLEDVMQASLPRMVRMVSVDDIGQGSESLRILGIKWLPSGAAARSVTEDGKLQPTQDDKPNDRTVPGEGEMENTDNDGNGHSGQTEQGEDGSEQQVAEGLEGEQGDFINVELSFAYRARSKSKTIKDRAKDMHLYMAFYLPSNIKLPVWVDLRGVVGTMRLRLQLCPDPPFFSLCTLTFLGQPKVELSCTPLSRHALNIMDVPLISNFVQSAVDAAMAQYVAPKSLNLDLKDMLSGDDFKKDTNARGVLVVNIKRGYDFRTGDSGIPLVKSGSSDPYVSIGWAKFGKPVWSTRLMMNEMEPWWDETAQILVTPEELNVDERLRVQLWDSDRLTADDDLGRIEVDLKEIIKDQESNGKMQQRTDGFRALKAGEPMPGKLEWSVGYFAKTKIQDCQLQRQTFAPDIKDLKQLERRVDEICERKLREATTKEGRHKHDADELDQQKAQEMKGMQDAMIISSPPPDGYPSGIFSIQIHQITGLELEKISKTATDKAKEGNDEEEEGEGLPSAYCTVIINHSKVFKTRTKPKNAKPFYNASTERYIPDWRNTEVYVSVRDARVKEDNPLLGVVHLPLGEIFADRSQVNGFYPLAGGIGYGRIRLSMVWRSIQLQAPPSAIGWGFGTLEIKPNITAASVPSNLRQLKLKLHTDLGAGKMYPSTSTPSSDEAVWSAKNDSSLKLPVHKRYSSCLAIQFRHKGMFHDNTAAFAILWLKDLVDEEARSLELDVWKGDFARAQQNTLPEHGEKVGSIQLTCTFWSGLGAAHSAWARKDENVADVVEVLEAARETMEEMRNETTAGVVDGTVSDSSGSDSEDDDEVGEKGEGEKKKNPIDRAKEFKQHHEGLNRRNRGVMQWKIPRTAQWAQHKLEHTESKLSGLFHHHSRQSGVETEV